MNDNFLKNLKQALSDTAEVVTKKTEDVVEVQKLRSQIYNARKNVETDYKKLGEILYQRYLSGESMDAETAEICENIHDVQEEIQKYQEELSRKKGRNVCDACDTNNPKDAVYCMKCGSKLAHAEQKFEHGEFETGGCPEECFVDEADTEEDVQKTNPDTETDL